MSKLELCPYIFFKGNCREAMEFYKSIFGGELTTQTYEESGQKMEGVSPDQLMHSRLNADGITIMGSDTAKASDKAAKISLSLMGDDEPTLMKIFDGLAEGGSVFMPLEKQFWGDTFGSLTDKYNVEWMVNINAADSKS
jgi:PhnB protein